MKIMDRIRMIRKTRGKAVLRGRAAQAARPGRAVWASRPGRAALPSVLLICLLAGLLAGCGSKQKDEEEIHASAEGFFAGLEKGDAVEIAKYATISGTDIMTMMDPEAMAQDLYDSLDIDPEALDETAKQSMLLLCRDIRDAAVTSYKITDVKEENGTGSVKAVVGWIGGEVLGQQIDEAKMQELVNNYITANEAELTEAAMNEDEAALMKRIYNGILPDVVSLLRETVAAASPVQSSCTLTIEKKGGKWMVTDCILPDEGN